MMNINNNNYELWLLRYAEQELTAEERREVELWLAEHPEAAEELALYGEAPRLERDESIKYAAPMHRTQPLWGALLQWAAAAAVVAALMVPAMRSALVPEMAPVQLAENRLPVEMAPIPSPSSLDSPTSSASQASQASQATLPSYSPEDSLLAEEAPLLQDTLPVIPVEETPAMLYVDDLIVFEDEPEPEPTKDYAVNEVTYVNDDSGINPVIHFLGIFYKITR